MKNTVVNSISAIVLFFFRHQFLGLAICLALLAGLAPQMAKITIDVRNESYLPPDEPVRLEYKESQRIFGSDEALVIGLKAKEGDIFTPEKLAYIKLLHEKTAGIRYSNDVNSLYNARITHAIADEVLIEELNEVFEEQLNASELDEIKAFVLSNPAYLNALINADGTTTTINVKLLLRHPDNGNELTNVEFAEAALELYDILEQYPSDLFDIYLSGSPIMSERISKSMEKDMGLFSGLSMLMIAVLLAVVFRRISAIIIPLAIVISALMLTFELMGLSGYPATATTQILPSMILAFGVCDAIHLLTLFFKEFNRCTDEDNHERKYNSLKLAIQQCAFPLLMTTLTTAGGLLSFAIADMPPIRGLGIFGAVGIISALFFTLILCPSLLAIIPIRAKATSSKAEDENPLGSRLSYTLTSFGLKHAKPIVAVTAVIMVFFAVKFTEVEFSHDPIKWFQADNVIRADVEALDREFNGHLGINLILDSGKADGINDPQFLDKLEWIDNFAPQFAEHGITVGSTLSLLEPIKEMHNALHADRDAYVIPDNKELIAQELLLIEMGSAEDLYLFTDAEKRYARIILNVPMTNLLESYFFLEELKTIINQKFEGDTPIRFTGTSVLVGRAFSALMGSMAKSYGLAFLLISVLIMLNTRQFRLGICTVAVNLLPILFSLSVLVMLDIPLNIFTMLIGSIMLGVVVDDSIHFIEHYVEHRELSSDIDEVLLNTSKSVGGSLLFTSVILGCGFLVYAFSEINNIMTFGLLCFSTCIIALLADLIILPAMIKLFCRQPEPGKSTIGVQTA